MIYTEGSIRLDPATDADMMAALREIGCREIARAVGLSPTFVSKWWLGRTAMRESKARKVLAMVRRRPVPAFE